jgi:filamentous hemagglutinin family protein
MNTLETRDAKREEAERLFGALLLAWLCLAEAWADASVALDGSLGRAGALPGPNYQIGADLGRLAGGNLFHSFGRFGLLNGESATFSGPAAVENIVGRVTGGDISRIDGLLRSTIPGANLFLLNPSGIAFGPNARLDIKGSFHASTADYLRFQDGGRFDAAPSAQDAVLSVAAPQAFGFLGDRPQGVSLDHSHLETPAGAALTLTGGDIDLNRAALATRDGPIHLNAAGRGEVDLAGQSALSGGGKVALENSELAASGTSGQGIVIRGGNFYAKDSTVETSHEGGNAQAADGVVIQASDAIALDGSKITARALGAGESGAVVVSTAGALTASNSLIRSLTGIIPGGDPAPGASADAGDVVVRAKTSSLSAGSALFSAALGAGKAGRLDVETGQLDMNQSYIYNQSGLFIDAVGASGGGARDIDLRVQGAARLDGASIFQAVVGPAGLQPAQAKLDVGELSLLDGAQIYNSMAALSGDGISSDGGGVRVDARGSVSLSGRSFISTDAGLGGKAGSATVAAGGDIALQDKAYIATFGGDPTRGDAQAGASGAIALRAVGDISFKAGYLSTSGVDQARGVGQSGAIALASGGAVSLTDGSIIVANSWGDGQGGDISVQGADIRVENSYITGASGNPLDATRNAGSAGNIRLRADNRADFVDAYVSSATYGHGQGGDIALHAGQLSMTDSFALSDSGAQHDAAPGGFVAGRGDAGAIAVNVSGDVSMLRSSLSTDTYGDGMAGKVILNARSASFSDGSFVTSKSLNPQGLGSAGDVVLNLGANLLLDRSYLRTDTHGVGHAGNILIRAGAGAALNAQSSISSETRGAGNGGAVSIETDGAIALNASAISSNTYSGGAAGGIALKGASLTLDKAFVASGSGVREDGMPATGNGGDMDIRVLGEMSLSGGSIVSQTQGDGEAGAIALKVGSLSMDRQAFVSAASLGRYENGAYIASKGDANNILIDAKRSIRLVGGAFISNSAFGEGHGGDIRIDAGGGAFLREGSYISSSAFGSGQGGAIALHAARLSLAEGGTLTTFSQGAGDGGDMNIQADRVDISGGWAVPEGIELLNGVKAYGVYSGLYLNSQGGSGRGGDLSLRAGALNVTNGGVIGSVTVFGDGDAGNLDIHAQNIRLTGGGLVANSTSGAGDAGRVRVEAGALSVAGRLNRRKFPDFLPRSSSYSGIDSSSTFALNPQAERLGDGGQIRIDAGEIDISDRGRIASATEGEGRGGDIAVLATNLRVSGGGLNAGSQGADANIEANPDKGHSGNIDIDARDSIRIVEGGAVTVATRKANAGSIALNAGSLLSLRDGGRIATSAAGGRGNGGNIETFAPILVLDRGSAIVARALFGHGGDIDVNSNYFQVSPDSAVDASSRFGVSGQVRIDSPVSYISGSLAVLPANLMDASRLSIERCAERAPTEEGKGSRFSLNGLRAHAWGPDDPLTERTGAPGDPECGETESDARE